MTLQFVIDALRELGVSWMLNRRVYVSRSGHYYPDLYCKIKIGNKWYILLVEVDEHQHTRNRRYKRENEKKRLIDLRVAMRLPMIVVRFNPDKCDKEHPNPWERDEQGIFRPVHPRIWEDRLETLVRTIRHLVRNPPDGLEQGLGIHLQFLYYDERNKYRRTPLFVASREGHLEIVQWLQQNPGAVRTPSWTGGLGVPLGSPVGLQWGGRGGRSPRCPGNPPPLFSSPQLGT